MTFPKYGKIETLFDRHPDTHRVVEGKFRCPEFELVSYWHVTEKVDGTNVRVQYEPTSSQAFSPPYGAVTFGGRTDNAQMPTFLLEYLQHAFTLEKLAACFPDLATPVTLFGEGYGGKIQKGGKYRPDASFRLFDVLVHGDMVSRSIWLLPADVLDVADKLGVATAPALGLWSTDQAVKLVKSGTVSEVAMLDSGQDTLAEGVVARAPHGLLNRMGRRVMFKLKTTDFA